MSPTLIIETEDKKYNYQQSKTGKVIDINKMYEDILGTPLYNACSDITGLTTITRGTWGTTDIPF
jgi:hypothetical protein